MMILAVGLTIDDYEAALEATWQQEVENFGWAAPPVLVSNPPPGNRYYVRIVQLSDPNSVGLRVCQRDLCWPGRRQSQYRLG